MDTPIAHTICTRGEREELNNVPATGAVFCPRYVLASPRLHKSKVMLILKNWAKCTYNTHSLHIHSLFFFFLSLSLILVCVCTGSQPPSSPFPSSLLFSPSSSFVSLSPFSRFGVLAGCSLSPLQTHHIPLPHHFPPSSLSLSPGCSNSSRSSFFSSNDNYARNVQLESSLLLLLLHNRERREKRKTRKDDDEKRRGEEDTKL